MRKVLHFRLRFIIKYKFHTVYDNSTEKAITYIVLISLDPNIVQYIPVLLIEKIIIM